MTARQFISRLAELKLIPLPCNIRSRRFRFNHSAPAKIELHRRGKSAKWWPLPRDRTSGRNSSCSLCSIVACIRMTSPSCGATRWIGRRARSARARSKTRHRNGPVVTYKLWPETFALLKKFRTEGELALANEEGNLLVRYWLDEKGKMRRYDCIDAAWRRLAAALGRDKMRLGLKHLRKTSSTALGQHPQYKYYGGHFLADSPKGMDQKHYVRPNDVDSSLRWTG